MAEEPENGVAHGTGRGTGTAMIAGGIAVIALALVFLSAMTRWFEYLTVAAVIALGIALVVRGAIFARSTRY